MMGASFLAVGLEFYRLNKQRRQPTCLSIRVGLAELEYRADHLPRHHAVVHRAVGIFDVGQAVGKAEEQL